MKLVADMATLKTPLVDALFGLQNAKQPLVRRLGEEILQAFDQYNRVRKFDGIPALPQFSASYPLARGVSVPVSPTFIIVEDGKLVPVFVIGWTTFPLTDFQRALLSTIINKAILTLSQFIGSDAEIIYFPRAKYCKRERDRRSWRISQAKLLTDKELAEHLDRYGNALDLAVEMLQNILDPE